MQTQLLQRFAPNSLFLLYHPIDTGSPGHDMGQHISRHASHRIDIESTQLIGDRVIGRVEHDLGPADEAELQHRILTVPYAERQLGSNADAVEFVRVIKQAVGAGADPDPRSLQIWASYAYNEIKGRIASHSPTPETSANDFKSLVIRDVLTEIAKMAMQLTAVTATNEERLLDEPEVYEYFGSPHYSDELDPKARRDLFERRCEEILDHHDTTDPFTAEMRAICTKLPRAYSSGNVYDEESKFQEYLGERIEAGDCDGAALQDSHERVTEQYDEGGVVSLHMSDGEKFVVDGTLEEDVDDSYLPQDTAHIATEIRQLYVEGEDLETIDAFIEFRLNQIYGDPGDKENRARRTTRGVVARKDGLAEYTYSVSVYPNREVRQYVREVLDQILESTKRDFIYRNMNRSTKFRGFMEQIITATDSRSLIETIQVAYKARIDETIDVKMFTALNTTYEVKRAAIESIAPRITSETNGTVRTFIPAMPVIALAQTIRVKNLRTLAIAVNNLPIEHREYVRRLFKNERPDVYARIQNGLDDIVANASQRTLGFLRYAFFEDRKNGNSNRPEDMSHLLTGRDKAALWTKLKAATGLAEPLAA